MRRGTAGCQCITAAYRCGRFPRTTPRHFSQRHRGGRGPRRQSTLRRHSGGLPRWACSRGWDRRPRRSTAADARRPSRTCCADLALVISTRSGTRQGRGLRPLLRAPSPRCVSRRRARGRPSGAAACVWLRPVSTGARSRSASYSARSASYSAGSAHPAASGTPCAACA